MGRSSGRRASTNHIGESFIPLVGSVLSSEAWRHLSPLGRALLIELMGLIKNWKWPPENNGRVFLSVRDAASALQCSVRSAREGFYELQRLGFIVVVELGHLGAEGHGKATYYRLTMCGCHQYPRGSKEYITWKPGADYPVLRGPRPKGQQRSAAKVSKFRPDA